MGPKSHQAETTPNGEASFPLFPLCGEIDTPGHYVVFGHLNLHSCFIYGINKIQTEGGDTQPPDTNGQGLP